MTKKEKETIESVPSILLAASQGKQFRKYLLAEGLKKSQLLGRFMATPCLPLSVDKPNNLMYRSHIQIIQGKVRGIP